MRQISHGSGSSRFGFRFIAIFLGACKLRWSGLYARTKLVFAILAVCAELGTAATITVGPRDDVVPIGIEPKVVTLHSLDDFTLNLGPFGTFGFVWKDSRDVVVHEFKFVTVKSYTTYEAVNFDPQTGTLRLTEITGASIDPGAGTVTGFDPTAPELQTLSSTVFEGVTGPPVTSDVNTSARLQDLNLLFPGFDLSPFAGDPNSIVYISQATVPARDGVVPEPGSTSLFLSGLFFIALATSRCKMTHFDQPMPLPTSSVWR